MSDNIVDIRSRSFTGQDRVFVDTNVWLFIYGPASATGAPQTATYSAALRRMRDARSSIYLDVLVLGEFINRFARIEYEHALGVREVTNFKSFRNGASFRAVAQEIATSATRIVNLCRRCQWAFSSANVGSMLVHYAQGASDFNDLALVELCREHGLTLVTDDADFKPRQIPILTANTRMLRPNGG
jgi:predicted nucleic acid-binding protein